MYIINISVIDWLIKTKSKTYIFILLIDILLIIITIVINFVSY